MCSNLLKMLKSALQLMKVYGQILSFFHFICCVDFRGKSSGRTADEIDTWLQESTDALQTLIKFIRAMCLPCANFCFTGNLVNKGSINCASQNCAHLSAITLPCFQLMLPNITETKILGKIYLLSIGHNMILSIFLYSLMLEISEMQIFF